jgi:DNA adenine methylase
VRASYNDGTTTFPDHYKGYIGFNGSYSGRFFDGGYAGTVTTKEGNVRNYPLEAFNNVMKQIPRIQAVEFRCCSYEQLDIPENSVVYCDIPYKGTKKYKTEQFDHDRFWRWCRESPHELYISEYEAPDDFECIWEKEVSSSLRANGVISGDKKSIERLFRRYR